MVFQPKLNGEDPAILTLSKPDVTIRRARRGRPIFKVDRLYQSKMQECFSKLTRYEKDELQDLLGVNREYFWRLGRGTTCTITKLNAEAILSFFKAVSRLFPERVPTLTKSELLNPEAYRYEDEVEK